MIPTLSWIQWGCVVAGATLLLFLLDALLARKRLVSLAGKVVVITGGSSGIGLAAAKDVARQGATVVLMARRQAVLDSARAEVEAAVPGARVVTASVSVTDNDAVKQAFDNIIKQEHQIDVLICSAGMSVAKKFEDVSPQEFERLMQVNVLGCANCARAVVGHMKRRGSGRIAFVSSAAGQVGIFGYTGYSASKFALLGFAQALQMELNAYNIAVSLAFPPDTNTPMLEEEDKTKPAETKEIAGTVSLLEPDQVASTLVSGVRYGRFYINFDFLGNLLGWLTAGFSPTTGLINNMLSVVMMPLGRLIALGLLWQWNGICSTHAKAARKTQ